MAMGGARVLRRLVCVRDRVVVVERAERRLGVHEVDVDQLEEAPVPVAGARALLEEAARGRAARLVAQHDVAVEAVALGHALGKPFLEAHEDNKRGTTARQGGAT